MNALMFFFLFSFILTGFLWTCGLVLLLILKSSQLLLLQIFLLFHSLFLQYFCHVYVTPFDVVPQFLDVLLFSSFFKSLYAFYFDMFLLIVFKLTDSFLTCVESTDEPLEEILNFYFCV